MWALPPGDTIASLPVDRTAIVEALSGQASRVRRSNITVEVGRIASTKDELNGELRNDVDGLDGPNLVRQTDRQSFGDRFVIYDDERGIESLSS